MRKTLKVIESLADIEAATWNGLVGDYPFLRHEFLSALHETGCASRHTGWQPVYLGLWQDNKLIGAMPLYLKYHSKGEFVFDQQWAAAFEQHGLNYYPKLLAAAPFTPVTGPRLLAADADDRYLLAQGALELANKLGVSSLHIIFPHESDQRIFTELGLLSREGIQFHWHNQHYSSFDDFLSVLNHDKRKKLKQEKRRVREAGIEYRWIEGRDMSEAHLKFFYQCYVHTYQEHYSSPYLNLEFYRNWLASSPDNLVWIMAMREDEPVACAFNVKAGSVLYGRYWGTSEFISGLHFETCYTQAIQYCIAHQLKVFEGGAQGLHKMSRGLMPTPTWSAHWIADHRFKAAIAEFLQEETSGIEHFLGELDSHTPFKKPDHPGFE